MLTQAQQAALRLDKNVFIEAAAGSGKTTMLVNRYLEILRQNKTLSPANILAITYTKKAAYEMLFRLTKSIDLDLQKAQITTIHGFCFAILRPHFISLGLDPSTALIEADEAHLFKKESILSTLQKIKEVKSSAYKTLRLYVSPSAIYTLIDTCLSQTEILSPWWEKYKKGTPFDIFMDEHPALKEHLTPDNYTVSAETYELYQALYKLVHRCLAGYIADKKNRAILDYDDLIQLALKTFKERPHIRHAIQKRYAFILVDECQDANESLWTLIQNCLADTDPLAAKKLFMVGDRFQSIYGFRGTHPKLFQDICDTADPNHTITVKATDNFRSVKPLVDFASSLFKNIFKQVHTPSTFPQLRPYKDKQNSTYLEAAIFPLESQATLHTQITFAAQWIQKECRDNSRSFSDFAILMRRKRDLETIKRILSKHSIPAQTHGGTGLFEKNEILDIYNMIKAFFNPGDDISWLGLLKSPAFMISDHALFLLSQKKGRSGSLLNTLLSLSKNDIDIWVTEGLSQADKEQLLIAKKQIPHWVDEAALTPPHLFVQKILTQTGAWALYYNQGPQIPANIHRLLGSMANWQRQFKGSSSDFLAILEHHLKHRELAAEEPLTTHINAVQILSIHAAKGLEFPVVILPELERSIYSQQSISLRANRTAGLGLSLKDEQENQNAFRNYVTNDEKQHTLDEELRVFYVAFTRAKEKVLWIGTEKKRNLASILSILSTFYTLQKDTVQLDLGTKRFKIPLYTDLLSSLQPAEEQKTPIVTETILPQHKLRETEPLPPIPTQKNLLKRVPKSIIALWDTSSFKGSQKDPVKNISSPETGIIFHKVMAFIAAKKNKPKATLLGEAETYISALCQAYNCAKKKSLIIAETQLFLRSPLYQKIQYMGTLIPEASIGCSAIHPLYQVRLDLLSESGVIIDFKTSDRPKKDHILQLSLYALIYHAKQRIPKKAITGHLYYSPTGLSISTTFTIEALELGYQALINTSAPI